MGEATLSTNERTREINSINYFLERRTFSNARDLLETLPLDSKKELIDILKWWEGLYVVRSEEPQQQIADLGLNRGVSFPDYLIRVDLAQHKYAIIGDDPDDHPGTIIFLVENFTKRDYQRVDKIGKEKP